MDLSISSESTAKHLAKQPLENGSPKKSPATKAKRAPSPEPSTSALPVETPKENYEDVEQKLEEMFAGIEDTNVTPAPTTVSAPKDVSQTKKKQQPNGDPASSASVSSVRKRRRGRPPLSTSRKSSDAGSANSSIVANTTTTPASEKKVNRSRPEKPPQTRQEKENVSVAAAATTNAIDTTIRTTRGPYVHISADGSITVVNSRPNDDEPEKSQKTQKAKKSGVVVKKAEINHVRGLHNSALSNKYDADTTDTSWICIFCKKGPHKNCLGDLFGPYVISVETQGGADGFKSPPRRGRKPKKTPSEGKVISPLPSLSGEQEAQLFEGMVKVNEGSYEIWMHEDCAVWAPGVYIVGTRIVGLDEAVWECAQHRCGACGLNGAELSCLRCKSLAHFICGVQQGWELTDEFKSFCPTHSKVAAQTVAQEISNTQPVVVLSS